MMWSRTVVLACVAVCCAKLDTEEGTGESDMNDIDDSDINDIADTNNFNDTKVFINTNNIGTIQPILLNSTNSNDQNRDANDIDDSDIDDTENMADTDTNDITNTNSIGTSQPILLNIANSNNQSRGDHDIEDSGEHIGAAVTQIVRHPYAASLLRNDSYICSAVILNTYWLLTQSKCFDSQIISSYVTHKNLRNYTVRVGSSYNTKGGTVFKITKLVNNFDIQISLVKLDSALTFSSRVRSVRLPGYDEEVTLGYLASILAWTPTGHMRVVNAPVIDPAICDSYTKLLPGHYICIGGVQDPNRHFCRKDNGGAVIQNNTLIGLTSYLHTCALYSRTHAFPKVSSFARWLDSVIWDEHNRPTTIRPMTTKPSTKFVVNFTENPLENHSPYFDPRKFMLTLPFDTVNVPLEPAEGNSVISRMSLYESYLQNLARAKTSTTVDPTMLEERKRNAEMEWMQKYGNGVMMMPQVYQRKRYEHYDYN